MMIKVLFFIPSLAGGGAEKVLVNLVNNMDLKKFDITLICLFDVGENKKYLREEVRYQCVFKHVFRGNVEMLKFFSPHFLFESMIKEKYDVVISYLESPTTRIVSGCSRKGTILVNWIHNEFHDLNKLKKLYRNEEELRESFSHYDATVFVAESAKCALVPLLPDIADMSYVIYNTIETDMIQRKSLEEVQDVDFDSRFINFISVGRFVEQKAFDRLIRIVGKLTTEDKIPVKLYLLGKGELKSQYMSLVKKLHLEEHVIFLGYKDNPYSYVRNADLFVCSSKHEGYSTAVTESLIVGTPVVTTACSGMTELLGKHNEYGIITENSEVSLYNGIKKLLQDDSEMERLRQQARKRGAFFSKEKTVQDVENLILELANRKVETEVSKGGI